MLWKKLLLGSVTSVSDYASIWAGVAGISSNELPSTLFTFASLWVASLLGLPHDQLQTKVLHS
jgi:hypothetical protein